FSMSMTTFCCIFFFFQAEDGIRGFHVTGVQTCALPISQNALHGLRSCAAIAAPPRGSKSRFRGYNSLRAPVHPLCNVCPRAEIRSEERRVGKECRYRGSPEEKR